MVNDAGFSSAYIKLFKEVEGINFETEASSGIKEKNVKSISRSIIINDEKIGELITQPKPGADTTEYEELLNYLLPVINISIHDSLVLRTVTDYKNNLEIKVEERTIELRKARDKLSGANHLLRDVQQAQNRFFTNISHEFRKLWMQQPMVLLLL